MREIKFGEGRIYTLSHADMVLLAEDEDEMRSMISRLKERKNLTLNTDKTKILRFRRLEGN